MYRARDVSLDRDVAIKILPAQFAYDDVFSSSRDGNRHLWTAKSDGTDARPLTFGLSQDERPAYSPEGRDIGGDRSRIPTPFFAAEPAMSPTRDVIAFISIKRTASGAINEVGFVDSTGRASYLNLPHPFAASGFSNGMLAWAPDGRRVAVVEQSANNTTRIWLIHPGQPQLSTRLVELQAARIRGIAWTADGSAIVYGKHDWTSDIVLMQREP